MSTTDDQRIQTLEALEAFIQTQKSLLARQKSDIDRLHQLKVDFVQTPGKVINNLSHELADTAFRISEQVDCRLTTAITKELDWSVFEKCDTGPLRTFTLQTSDTHTKISQPSTTQRSNLSELQRLVKQARRTIVDPILARFSELSLPNEADDEESEEEDPMERRRREEHEKIRELKKRKIRGCGLSLPLSSMARNMGVIIREDPEGDGAMDVDISIDDVDSREAPQLGGFAMDVEEGEEEEEIPVSSSAVSQHWAERGIPTSKISTTISNDKVHSDSGGKNIAKLPLPPRQRNRKVVPKSHPFTSKSKSKLAQSHILPRSDDESASSETEHKVVQNISTTKKGRGNTKPKPETYKQAWSESEQNLLEQLLEQIPEGEKFRWQKISKAMGGRRTPRQVASRVQKYFEKLKRFGVSVDA